MPANGTTDDATLKFATSHDAPYSIDTPYEAVDITVPTTDAYLQQFYDTVTARQEEYDNDRTTYSLGLNDIFE